MERSSPLAALQPNMPVPWARSRDAAKYEPGFLKPHALPSTSFNFKEIKFSQPKLDYFSCNTVRGSSPAASLAADLSQNFHIDQTPQASTPRRSLFTNLQIPNLNCQASLSTPSLAPSSPLLTPDTDIMDYSPLPHKPPFVSRVPELQIPTGLPTPDPTPILEQEDISPLTGEPPAAPEVQEMTSMSPKNPSADLQFPKRRPIARPTIRKQISSSAVPSKLMGTQDSHHPSFLFGMRGSTSAIPTLESFAESPPSERKPLSSVSSSCLISGAPVAKFLFPTNGSPAGPTPRRLSVARPPRQGLSRRSQSMQCGNSSRPVRQEKRACTDSISSVVELEDVYAPKLPHFKPDNEPDSLPRITNETLVDLLQGRLQDQVADPVIIDCRFEYEYNGGHVEGAINYNDKEALAKHLFDGAEARSRTLIFHCEYSAHRAPIMARFIRQRDRTVNADRYPELTYPEVYILDGGYSNFFQTHRNMCFPQEWVKMDAEGHETACERGMANVKRRTKLARAQTYAFGQSFSSAHLDSSPLPNPGRGLGLSNLDFMDVDHDSSTLSSAHKTSPNPFVTRPFRRLESY